MKTSDNGRKLIESFEGLSLKAYKLTGESYYTIGYGHSFDKAVTASTVWTRKQADEALKNDLAKFEGYVNRYVNITLTQNAFDALVSYTYNRGLGGLKELIANSKTFTAMGNNIVTYWGSALRYKAALINRRKKERELYFTQEEDEDEMTQEQFNVYIENYFSTLKSKAPSGWSEDGRKWAEEKGIIIGDENGNKQYKAFVTREQLAVVLKKAME